MADYKVPAAAGGGGGGGLGPWLPVEGLTYAGMSLLDNYVTGVTDNGGGNYTFDLDFDATTRTFPGNGDLHIFDLITAWAAAGSATDLLQFRITVTSAPTDLGGTPYVAFYHGGGVGPARAIAAMTAVVFFGPTGRSMNTQWALNTAASVGTLLGTPNEFVFTFQPPVGTLHNRYTAIGQATATTETDTRNGWVQTLLTSVRSSTTDVGYNVAGGAHCGIALQQLGAGGTGTGTVALTFEYRFAPVE